MATSLARVRRLAPQWDARPTVREFSVSFESARHVKMQRERGSAQASDGDERYNGGVSVSGNSYGYAQQQVRRESSSSSSSPEMSPRPANTLLVSLPTLIQSR